MRERTNDKSRAKNVYSRRIQTVFSGRWLKLFDEEVSRDKLGESTVSAQLLREALQARIDRREKKNPFFK